MTFDPFVSPRQQQLILSLENSPDFLNSSPTILGLQSTISPRSWGSEVFCTLRISSTSVLFGSISWTTTRSWLLEWGVSQPGLFFVLPALESSEGILFLAPFFLEDHESFLPTTQPAAYSSTLIDQLLSQISERRSDWYPEGSSTQKRYKWMGISGLFGLSRLMKIWRPGEEFILPEAITVSQSISKPLEGQSLASVSGSRQALYASLSGAGLMRDLEGT